jgi:3-oxoadipate enol-lactonase
VPTVQTNLGTIYVADQGAADAPAVLLWPSLFTDHAMWRQQIPVLHEVGLRTLALDPPGHGRSPGPARGFTMDECAEAVEAVLDAAGVDAPIVLLGTSWGGFVGPRFALRAPDRVRGLMLFNSSAERGTLLERAKALLLTTLLGVRLLDGVTGPMIVSGLLAPETRRLQPETGRELAKKFLSWDRRGFNTAVRSVLVDRDAVFDALSDIRVPTLVVSGQQDHTLPSAHSARIAATVPGARHVEVADAAHLVPLEAPGEANALITDFLRNLPTI